MRARDVQLRLQPLPVAEPRRRHRRGPAVDVDRPHPRVERESGRDPHADRTVPAAPDDGHGLLAAPAFQRQVEARFADGDVAQLGPFPVGR